MILDKGHCEIYAVSSEADGNLPTETPTKKYESYYGELSFENTPKDDTGAQDMTRVDNRIRVLQNRSISTQDIAVLDGEVQYEIVRAYHGTDDDGVTLISDLSLERLMIEYDIT